GFEQGLSEDLEHGLSEDQEQGLSDDPVIKSILPDKLTHLKFGDAWNQDLEPGMLPRGIVHLEFGSIFCVWECEYYSQFNRLIKKDVLPDTLTLLRFGHKFNQPLDKNVLPCGFTTLVLSNMYK